MNVHKMIKCLCTISVLIFLTGLLNAQDAHLSQYDASPMYINPGMTGMYKGDYRAYINYRNQWSAVGNKPWTTYAVSYDRPYKRYGMGAFVMNNQAGIGGFNVLNFVLSGAYEITQDPKLYNHLSVGLQLGFIHKYFNPGNYVYLRMALDSVERDNITPVYLTDSPGGADTA